MKANCLTRALDQWNENKDIYILLYNSDHVISIEKRYGPFSDYQTLDMYGYKYFISAFKEIIDDYYIQLLLEYFEYQNYKIT